MDKLQELKERAELLNNNLVSCSESLDGAAFTDEQETQWDEFSNELASVKKEISTLERLQSLQPAASKETKSFKPSVSFSKKNVDTNEAFKGWALAQVNRKEHITNSMMEHAQAGKVSFDEPITASVKWNQVKGTDANGGFAVNEAVLLVSFIK